MELFRIKCGEYEGRVGFINRNVPNWKEGYVQFISAYDLEPLKMLIKEELLEKVTFNF